MRGALKRLKRGVLVHRPPFPIHLSRVSPASDCLPAGSSCWGLPASGLRWATPGSPPLWMSTTRSWILLILLTLATTLTRQKRWRRTHRWVGRDGAGAGRQRAASCTPHHWFCCPPGMSNSMAGGRPVGSGHVPGGQCSCNETLRCFGLAAALPRASLLAALPGAPRSSSLSWTPAWHCCCPCRSLWGWFRST